MADCFPATMFGLGRFTTSLVLCCLVHIVLVRADDEVHATDLLQQKYLLHQNCGFAPGIHLVKLPKLKRQFAFVVPRGRVESSRGAPVFMFFHGVYQTPWFSINILGLPDMLERYGWFGILPFGMHLLDQESMGGLRQCCSDLCHADECCLDAKNITSKGAAACGFYPPHLDKNLEARSFYLWRGPFGRAVAKEATLTHIFSGSSGRQSTLGVFMFEAACSSSTMTFTTVGVGHFKHWVINFPQNSPITVSQKKGVYGKNPARNPLDWAWRKDDGSAWLVADNGQLYMVMNHSASKPLACVEQLPGGRWIAGAVDGTIYVGSGDSMKVEEEIPFAELQGSQAQAFSSTATARFNAITVRRHLAVFGCSNHALFLVDYTRLELLRVLQVSHTTEATASARGGVRFWNVADRKAAVGKVLRSEFPAWSLAFQPTDGSLLAVGMDKGLLEVMHFPSLQPTFRERLSRSAERVSSLRFSPCGRYLAAGSWDQEVYLLHIDSESRVTLHRILSGNSSSIVSVMFSEDSRYVMSNSKDCQILHWTTKDGTLQRSQSVFRDTRWQAPWTSVLGWPVVGIWSDPKYDASDINSACQAYAPHHDLLAFGDDYGCVKLLRYPSPFLNPRIEVFTGHASFVTAVRFSPSNVLVTLGGDDHSICQWSLQPRGFEEDLTPTLRHPWAELEGSEAPQDRFAFLGRSEEATPREDPDPEPRRSRVFQDINQVQIGEEEKRATGPTGKRFYHHQQSQGVRNALQWD